MRFRLLAPVLAVGLAGLVYARAQQGPVDTVNQFLERLAKNDLTGAASLIEGSRPPQNMGNVPSTGLSFRVKSSRTFGDEKETIVVVDLDVVSPGGTRAVTDVFRLRQIDGQWRILAESVRNENGLPPSIMAMILKDSTPVRQAQTAAKKTVCLSHVKQLALGTIMYAGDYDDVLPDASKWRASVSPYLKNDSVFHCPEDPRPAKVSSYRMNPALSRKSLAKIGRPAETVMILEADGAEFTPRHAGMGSVGFTDGHAKVVTADAYKTYRQKP